jgi:alkyl hydroperoxide reductase subunit AhpC
VVANQIPEYHKNIYIFEKYNTQILAISVDSIPSHKAWAKSLGGLSFPLMSDYYPHGQVSEKYGVLNHRGYSERVIFVIDITGKIKYIEDVGLSNLPDNEKLFKVLANLQ